MVVDRQGPLIVTALFGRDDFAWLEGLRRTYYPADRNRVPAHLTLFHHLPPSLESELGRRLAALTCAPPPAADVTGVVDLGGGTALRVESEGLELIRAELADAFHGLTTPQDRAEWRPHVTIQNKVELRDARRLQEDLRRRFRPRPLAIRGLGSWRYTEGRWTALKEHPFRR